MNDSPSFQRTLLVSILCLLAAEARVAAQTPGIHYTLPDGAQASLAVYASHGSLVRRLLSGEKLAAGAHSAGWDGLDRNGSPDASGIVTELP